jgi:hypothetical protein
MSFAVLDPCVTLEVLVRVRGHSGDGWRESDISTSSEAMSSWLRFDGEE